LKNPLVVLFWYGPPNPASLLIDVNISNKSQQSFRTKCARWPYRKPFQYTWHDSSLSKCTIVMVLNITGSAFDLDNARLTDSPK